MLWSFSTQVSEPSPWHDHDILEFVLCCDTGGRLVTADGAVDFRPERTLFVPPNTPHRFELDAGQVGRLKIVCVPRNDLMSFLSPRLVTLVDTLCTTGVTVADHPGRATCLADLAAMISDGFTGDEERGQQVDWSAVGVLLALHARERRLLSMQPPSRYSVRMHEVVAWVEAHLEDNLTLEHVASEWGLSRSLFTKEFRRYTGRSFVEYCNARRVQKAATLLVTRQETVTRAAYAAGFSNISHFHRQFKQHFGLTPAAFRRQLVEQAGL